VADTRQLSQRIEPVVQRRSSRAVDELSRKARPYDFRRPDRIAKDQLRSVQMVHENFARNLSSSLSAYLRAYVAVTLVSVEQLAFAEFTQPMASPTFLVALGLKPLDGRAVLEMSPVLVFPVLEILLGGSGKNSEGLDRKVTEIEQSILDDLLRIILHDLRTAWQAVTPIEFSIDSHETEPSLVQVLGPGEAIVAIGLEMHAGEAVGMLNLGIPSVIIKMLRRKFDQQWSLERTQPTEKDHRRLLNLIEPANLRLDVRLSGPTLKFETLLALSEGDVLSFDYPVERPLQVTVNGKVKYRGEVLQSSNLRAVKLLHPVKQP
jgi:flagellar motor switch protein FliM